MESNLFDEIVNRSPKDSKIFVSKALDMSDALYTYMKETKTNQKDLADKLGKKESEVSKWLQGMQNFTFKTVSKIEAVLGVTFVHVSSPADITKSLMVLKIRQNQAIVANSSTEYNVTIDSTEFFDISDKNIFYQISPVATHIQ